jgi:hypothetical protein
MTFATPRMTARSNGTISSRCGRRTFTATSRPSCRRARCTCATDALAMGSTPNSANSVSGGEPKSSPIVRCTCVYENGPTRSCSASSARMMCGGRRSGRVDMICPTLMNVAPRSRNSASSEAANHSCRAALSRSVASMASHPANQRTECHTRKNAMTAAR